MEKIPIYFMPGLAAGPEIFENLEFCAKKYTLHYLHWIQPLHVNESISNYAFRMSATIKEKKPVLIGVSFGGVLTQELAQFVKAKKVIIISSIKHHEELPLKYQIAKHSKIYKIFPLKIIENFETYSKYFLGSSLSKKAQLYQKYLSVRNKEYLTWSISAMLNWEQKKPIENIVHIHGTEDPIFPIKNIQNSLEIKGGTHIMILTKAKKISKIIDSILTC
jgi:pimeloyl-ACP methyl ester carboxylesterase